jgi:hypothetical protein
MVCNRAGTSDLTIDDDFGLVGLLLTIRNVRHHRLRKSSMS